MKKVFLFLCLPLVLPLAGAFGIDQWDLATFLKLMAESGRPTTMSPGTFDAVQARIPEYLSITKKYLNDGLGHVSPTVMKAFEEVPRLYFMYNYQERRSIAQDTYRLPPRPWAIGYGSYISDYRAQAYMTQILEPKADEVSLEIGTGSGFQSAILSRIVKEAYTIEIITPLAEAVHEIYGPIGFDNVHTRAGDGYYGWPEVTGGFDIIIVTAAAPYVPPPLLEQLKPNGRMIIPIGEPYQTQFLYLFTKDAQGKVHSSRNIPTYFIPMTGRVQQGGP
jgi:protein-L-isoaspartate(D-aspartate) O-methyltransferase